MSSSLEQEIKFLKSLKYDSKIVLQPQRIRLFDFILGDPSRENIARFPTGSNLRYPVMLRCAVWCHSDYPSSVRRSGSLVHLCDRFTRNGPESSCGRPMPYWGVSEYREPFATGDACHACLAHANVAMLPGQRIANRVEAPDDSTR